MHNPNELEIKFSVALVRLLRNFNLLDLNLGLCISQYANLSKSDFTIRNMADSSVDQKLRSLEQIVTSSDLAVPDDIRPQLMKWIGHADNARGTRNTFTHGHWELLPLSDDAPIRLHAPPWMRERLNLHAPIRMQIDDLVAIADEMEVLVRDFLSMRTSLKW